MRTHLPHRARSPIPAWLTRRDVVVHRGLRSEILEEALVREAGSATRWCNPIGASLDVLRRDRLNALLEGAGVPVPAARVVEGWAQARELARRVGAATGLEVYGADVLVGDDGPRVVDVNAFPGFRGVPDAAEAVARHVLVVARRSRYPTSTGHKPSR